ncbi:MAG: hypothetical protein ACRD1M_08300, partial [Terriglobales bacterium]
AVLRRAARRDARGEARRLLVWRLAPALLSATVVGLLCLPSYLWLEPRGDREAWGWGVCLVAIAGLALALDVGRRAARALLLSWRYGWRCRQQADPDARPESGCLVLSSRQPVMALAGLWRPRILISRSVLACLTPEQLAASLRHEQAHRAAGDNWKRLLLASTPAPGPRLARLERAWARAAEWAADDHSVTSPGRSPRARARHSLQLAGALVAVARLGAPASEAPLVSALLSAHRAPTAAPAHAASRELEARVRRLLESPPSPPRRATLGLWRAAALAATAAVVALALAPATLNCVHQLIEFCVH